MEKKFVVAGEHGPVAMEENSRRFIGEEPVEVKLSTYYRRRLSAGELVIAESKAKPKPVKAPVVTSAPVPEVK